MPRENDRRYEEIQELLGQLDLCYHSLKLVGQQLVSESRGSSHEPKGVLYQKSLQLSRECSRAIRDLSGHLDSEELDLCQSALNRLDLAVRRASQSGTVTLRTVHIWRVIEATDRYLGSVSAKYGYVRLSQEMALEALEKQETRNAQLAELFREYKEAMATEKGTSKPIAVPFSHGILRWQGRQLYCVERLGRGVRWIELDPDYDGESINDEEDEGVELIEARTIEGYLIELRLDATVDESEVESYLRQQTLSPYIVSGAQIAREQKKRRGRRGRRR